MCVYVCMHAYVILDFPGISLLSAKTNSVASEVGEYLLGSIIIFLFSGCGRVWEFLMLPNMGETWGSNKKTMILGGYFECPRLLEFYLLLPKLTVLLDVKSAEPRLEF